VAHPVEIDSLEGAMGIGRCEGEEREKEDSRDEAGQSRYH